MTTVAIPSHGLLATLRVVASDIKLAHSVFALPFALLAAFMAAFDAEPIVGNPAILWRRFWVQLALVLVAMVLARSAAMLANRLLDRAVDARNPRTAGRALPSQRLTVQRALAVLLACVAAFALVCAAFGLLFDNWLPLLLAPLVLAWLCAYPLTKRFTALCHLWLGASLAISPLAAAIAVDPVTILPDSAAFQPALWLLGAMVLGWVAGFDIIYALQDVEVDRAQRLHSMPAWLGISSAMWVSRCLHAAAAACLIAAWLIDDRLEAIFGSGVVIVIALLVYEHLTVARWGASRIALAFFTLNGIISCVLGALGIADVLL